MWLHGCLPVTIRQHSGKAGGIGLVEEEISIFNLTSDLLWSRDQIVQLFYEICLTIRQHPAKFGRHTSSGGRNIFFSLSSDFIWLRSQRNMWIHGCVYLTINHQLGKFHGHRPCQRRYVTLLTYHVTTSHHVVRGLCDFIGGFLSP